MALLLPVKLQYLSFLQKTNNQNNKQAVFELLKPDKAKKNILRNNYDTLMNFEEVKQDSIYINAHLTLFQIDLCLNFYFQGYM